MNKNALLYLIPICIMALITPFTPYLDLKITSYFYHPESQLSEKFATGPFFDFLFYKGILPAWGLFLVSLFVLTLSYFKNGFKKYQKESLCLVLTFIMGAGVFTHLILKDHYGRPRPKQVVEFGGSQDFRPYYSPNFFNQQEPSKSFPCGHCSMGFYFFSLAVLGLRLKKNWLTVLGFSLSIILGGLLGAARIMQGAHFFSDVLFSALLLWITALLMDAIVYEEPLLKTKD